MQTKPKLDPKPKKTFSWGVTSTNIGFMQVSELQAARDGSASDCGSNVQPLKPVTPRRSNKASDKG